MLKIQAAGAAFSSCEDRFVTKGYRKGLTTMQMLDEFAKIKGITGVNTFTCTGKELAAFKAKVEEHNLLVGTVCPNTYQLAEQKVGTFTSRDPMIRKKYIQAVKDAMDCCAELNGYDVLLWMAHDGYDYPFEDDYTVKWDWMLDALAECSEYRGDVKLVIEYKMKEPRTHQYINTVGTAVSICERIGRPNLGVVVDLGHSFFAGEAPAEAVEFAHLFRRLFDIHVNDNYRSWDDDLIVGSVHFWETLEFFYSLERINYNGWYIIDIWPSRVNSVQALDESVKRIYWFKDLAKKLMENKEFAEARETGETMIVQRLLRELISEGSCDRMLDMHNKYMNY